MTLKCLTKTSKNMVLIDRINVVNQTNLLFKIILEKKCKI